MAKESAEPAENKFLSMCYFTLAKVTFTTLHTQLSLNGASGTPWPFPAVGSPSNSVSPLDLASPVVAQEASLVVEHHGVAALLWSPLPDPREELI